MSIKIWIAGWQHLCLGLMDTIIFQSYYFFLNLKLIFLLWNNSDIKIIIDSHITDSIVNFLFNCIHWFSFLPEVQVFNFFFNFFFFFFYFIILYWFCQTSTWIRHGRTHIPHPEHPSHLPPHTIPPSHPSAPAPSILYQTWTGDSFLIWYYTCFSAIPHSLSHRVQKTVLYICVSFAVSHTGLSLPSF